MATNDDESCTKNESTERSSVNNLPVGETSTSNNDVNEQQKIIQAIKFWKHPSLHNVSSKEKRAFLYERGLSDAQIHKVWEKMVEDDEINQSSHAIESRISNTPDPINPHSPLNLATQRDLYQPSLHGVHHQNQQMNPYYRGTVPHHDPHVYGASEDGEGAISVSKGVSLMAVGGLLGLSAAAAVRWLNGGDFQLFPPPRPPPPPLPPIDSALPPIKADRNQEIDGAQQDTLHENHDEDVLYADNVDEDVYQYDDDDNNECDNEWNQNIKPRDLFEKMDQLLQALSPNTKSQDDLLLKIAGNRMSSFTNQSMELLRCSTTQPLTTTQQAKLDVSSVLHDLMETKRELSNISDNTSINTADDQRTWETKQRNLTEKLQACIDSLKGLQGNDSDDPPKRDEVTCTENMNPKLVDIQTRNELHVVPSPKSVHEILGRMEQENDPATFKAGAQLLYLYFINLCNNPGNPRYRKIFTSNQSFQKVDTLAHGKELLSFVGFVKDQNKSCFEWVPSHKSQEELDSLTLVQEAANSIRILTSGTSDNLSVSSTTKPVTPTPTQQHEQQPHQDAIKTTKVAANLPDAPQTPAGGSMLESPPATKKLLFPESASAQPPIHPL